MEVSWQKVLQQDCQQESVIGLQVLSLGCRLGTSAKNRPSIREFNHEGRHKKKKLRTASLSRFPEGYEMVSQHRCNTA